MKHPPIGIGTSNRPIAEFITLLQNAGVSDVADIRQTPRSRFYPQYNQGAFREALSEVGIEYHWFGDTLGNPKDSEGKRSLAGFHLHMESESYQRGLHSLLRLIDSADGVVALVCSERNEDECHRKFVLEDIMKAGDKGKV